MMTEKIYIDWDEALAAVKIRGLWRFFYDIEIMFLVDYSSFDPEYDPSPGEWRYGTIIVDENNVEQWMESISGEVQRDELSYTFRRDTDHRVMPTFVIDFDKKLWVGGNWQRDQSALDEFQPDDWTAVEDNVMQYLPLEIRSIFE